jgi:hypothetical protein
MHVSRRAASPARRLTAFGLILSIAGYLVPAGAIASTDGAREILPPAVITGHVVMADGLTAVPGVNVMASHSETSQIYASGRTGEDGTYTLNGLPAGAYDLRIETPEGIYATDGFEVASGTRAIVSLALGPIAADEDEGEEGEEGEGEATDDAAEGEEEPAAEGEEPPEPEKKKKDKGGGIIDFIKRPVGAITTIVVSSVIIGSLANSAADDTKGDDDQPMTQSGSAP